MKALADLDESLSSIQPALDFRKQRSEPGEEHAVGAIADAQPYDPGSRRVADAAGHEILVLRQLCPISGDGEVPDAAVIRIAQSQFADRCGRKTVLTEPAAESGRQLRVHQKPHGSRGDEDGMVKIARRIGDAGADVFGLQIGEVGEDLFLCRTSGKHVQHILDANPHPADARPPAALVRIEGDALKLVHK